MIRSSNALSNGTFALRVLSWSRAARGIAALDIATRGIAARGDAGRGDAGRGDAGRGVAGRATVVLSVVAGLGGCAFPVSPQSHTDRATLAACRQYASQVYDQNNRAAIYTINQVGLPYSGSYLAGNQTYDLAARYHNDQVVDDCVRNTGTEINRGDAAPPSGDTP